MGWPTGLRPFCPKRTSASPSRRPPRSVSPFEQGVLRAEHGIPRGKVSTYQRIARHLGSAQAARAVGTALAHNPFPIIVPCHRAIRSDGTLGGFQGGVEMKRVLLEMEGGLIDGSGRVVPRELFY